MNFCLPACHLKDILSKRAYTALIIIVLFAQITRLNAQNNALSLDGSNDFVSVPALGTGYNQFTIETWINPASLAAASGFNGLFNTYSWEAGDVHFQINNSKIELAVNGSPIADVPYSSFTLNNWHHLAATYNAVTKKVCIYINGTLLQSLTLTDAVQANFSSAEIGAWTTQRYFSGIIDEYRIWSTERTSSEIKDNMFSSITGTETGLLAAFSCNQGIAGGTNTGLTSLLNSKGSNNGTLSNFALTGASSNWITSTTPSIIADNCLSFNGTSNWVSCGSVNPVKFTIEAWALPTAVSADQAVVSTLNTSTNSGVELHIGTDSYPYVTIRNGAAFLDIKGPAKAVAGTWIHLAATFDGVTCNLFVNGVKVASQTSITYSAGTSTLLLGVRSGPSYYFSGKIDDVRIWNRVLTETNLADSLYTVLKGSEKGLLAHYGFNQGTAGGTNTSLTTLISSTGTNHGTLTNFTLSGAASNWVTGFKPAPTNHVTNFTGSLVSNKLTLTWTDATGTTTPDGYLIYASKTNTFDNPVDGVYLSDDNDLGNGTGVIRIAMGIQSYNGWINEDINTTYYFRIIPLTNPGVPVKYLVTQPIPLVLLTSKQLFAQITIPSFQFSTGNYWGDYNNDGWLDYVASSYNDGNSTVFLNNKNNTFSINPAFNDISHSNLSPGDWVDINYDGNLDIPAKGGIYLNGSNGALFSLVTIPRLKSYIDIDKDGDLDLVGEIYPSNNISILRNNGALAFTEVTGNYFKDTDGSFNFLDYNNDGYPDIVISGRYSLDYKLHTTLYKNDGTGKFTDEKQILLDGLGKTRIKTGDVNSDGKDDIILTGLNNEGKFSLLLYLNNNGVNFNKISIPMQVGIAEGFADLADVNNDGLADIIFAGSNADRSAGYFKVLRNNGDQTFSEIFDLPGLTSPGTCNITDFNNDGAIDIIVNGSIILQNISAVTNLSPQKVVVTSAAKKDAGVEFQWSGTDDKTPSAGLTYNLRIGRSTGASDVQATTSLPSGQRKQLKPGNVGSNSKYYRPLSSGTYYWSVQAVDNSFKGGAFSTEQSIVVDSVAAGKLQAISSDKSSLKIKWVNGNGTKRALFCKIGTDGTTKPANNVSYTASVTFGEGDQIGNSGWYCVYNGIGDSVTVQNLTEFNTYVFQVFEFFGNKGAEKYMLKSADGNPAIFGTSGFTKQSDIAAADYSNNNFLFGDYNNDNLVDFLTINDASGLRIFKNKGNNTFELQAIPSIEKLDYGTDAWVDFNNDGWLDIIATGEYSINFYMRPKSTRLYRNDQNNVFTDVSGGTAVIPGLTESALAAADYNNDGKVDFFVGGTESLWDATTPVIKSKIYKNNGTPTDCFTEQTDIELPALNHGAAIWGDLNNDGWTDLLLSGASADNFYYLYHLQNNKNNSFSEKVLLKLKSPFAGADYNNSKIKTLDYDKDGNLDILIFIGNNHVGDGNTADTTILFHNNGSATFSKVNIIDFPKSVAYNSFDVGDFNNDKAQDIVFSTSVNPNLFRLYQNDFPVNSFAVNPDFNFSWANSSDYFHNWNGAAFCDYDNDGDADILASNYNQIYFINNNRVMKSGTFPVNKTPEAPSNVRATQRPGELVVDWSPVTSDETGSLSYNVVLSSGGTLINSSNSNMTSGKLLIPATGNAGLNNFAIFKGLPVGTYSITVQAVDGAFAGGAWSTPVTVELKNTKAFFTFDTVCYKAATKLSDLSTSTKKVVSRKWKYNNSVVSTDSVAHFVFPNAGTNYMTLVITDGEGTKDSVTHAIKIKARPTASFSASTVCLGSPTSFVNNSSRNGAGTVTWSWNYDNGDPASTDSIPLNKIYGLAKTYNAILTVTAANGCADTLARDVIVAAIPNVVTSVNGLTTFCSGDSVLLNVENNPSYNYKWQLNNNNLPGSHSGSFAVKTFSGSYTVEVTNPLANCIATSAPVTVVIKEMPDAPTILVSDPTTICAGDSTELRVTALAGHSYLWKLNDGSTGLSSEHIFAKNTGIYSLVVRNSTGCSSNSLNQVALNVKPLPVKSTITLIGEEKFCNDKNAKLSVPLDDNYTYTWKKGNVSLGTNSNSITVNESGDYTAEITLSGCTLTTPSRRIDVVQKPVKPVIDYGTYSKGECLKEDPIILSVSNIVPDITYKWYRNGALLNTSSTVETRDAGRYYVTADNVTCSDSASLTIDLPQILPEPQIYVQGPPVWMLSTVSNPNYLYRWYFNGTAITGAEVNSYVAGQKLGLYRVAISDDGICYAFSDTLRIPKGITGIEDTDPFSEVKIYPNPTSGLFTIEMNNSIFGELVIDIFSQKGSKVLKINIEKTTEHFSTQIDLNGQSKGMYLVNLSLDKYRAVRKVLVE